ncbi:mitochondrial ATP synthase 6 kDa subunit [Hordeum vulgare]|nr:mitochondrial ATP synthase 6 kDa subunit [Hordeum vulgare]
MKFFSAFDPWPVFFRREWGRTWPFLAGFATTGAIITKITAGFTEEDLKNSKFVQAHKGSKSHGQQLSYRHVSLMRRASPHPQYSD